MTISEIQAEEEMLEGLTNQKMSALLKKLVDSQRVEKYIEKKKTFFKAI
jgi:DNA-binding transcriptional regulator GbsR (MarR family)